MNRRLFPSRPAPLLALALLAGATALPASAGLLDSVKGAVGQEMKSGTSSATASGGSGGGALAGLGGLGLPAIGSGTASNAAGVLGYCIKNNYLAGGAQGVKDSLMGKLGLGSKPQQDEGYRAGLGGVLTGSDGASFSLKNVSTKVKRKACDYVLDNAQSLL